MARLNIFTGAFGSGKTEVAINHAIEAAKKHKKVIIVDLDIVNPYFRTKDAESILKSYGIDLIAPNFAGTNVDVPSLPADIMRIFSDKEAYVIIDLGGDDEGAVAIGRYSDYIKKEEYDMCFVANLKRPMFDNADSISELIKNIEFVSRLKANKIINNTHLMWLTDEKLILDSIYRMEDISKELGLTLVKTTVEEGLYAECFESFQEKFKNSIIPIKLYSIQNEITHS